MNESFIIVIVAIIGGALRVSTPFMFVALGECLTEKSGRVNLGLEGTLVLGAMCAYAMSFHTGSPWLGVLAAGCAGAALGAMHGYVCKLPRVNDIAIGIAMMLFGTGLASIAILPGSVDTEMLVGSGFAAQMTADDVAAMIVHAGLDAPEALTGSAIEMFG